MNKGGFDLGRVGSFLQFSQEASSGIVLLSAVSVKTAAIAIPEDNSTTSQYSRLTGKPIEGAAEGLLLKLFSSSAGSSSHVI